MSRIIIIWIVNVVIFYSHYFRLWPAQIVDVQNINFKFCHHSGPLFQISCGSPKLLLHILIIFIYVITYFLFKLKIVIQTSHRLNVIRCVPDFYLLLYYTTEIIFATLYTKHSKFFSTLFCTNQILYANHSWKVQAQSPQGRWHIHSAWKGEERSCTGNQIQEGFEKDNKALRNLCSLSHLDCGLPVRFS